MTTTPGMPQTGAHTGGSRAIRTLLLLAFVVSFSLVAADLGFEHYGIPSDEHAYHEAARRHARWFGQLGQSDCLSEETLAEHFDWNPKVVIHPTFSRLLSGLGWAAFRVGMGLDEVVSLRLHNALAYALGAVLVVWFAWRTCGLMAAVLAMGLYWGNIRFFGHAHTAMPDMLLSVLWLGAALALTRRHQAPRALLLAAVLAGLALATKLTGGLLVGLLAGWVLLADGPRAWRGALVLLAVPPLVFLALNPQTWNHPVDWVAGFLATFGAREREVWVPTLFLGVHYGHRVPWYVPAVHGLITTPPTLLLAALAAASFGVVRLFRQGVDQLRAGPWPLLVVAGLAPLVVTSLPSVPAHDLERLYLPLQPFLVLFATRGFHDLVNSGLFRRLGSRGPVWLLPGLVAAVLTVPALTEAVRQHPYQLSYFNTLVGGAAGADESGFDVAYLKLEANGQALDAVQEHIGPGQSLLSNFLNLDLALLQRDGRVRADIRLVDRLPADFVLIHARRSWMNRHEQALWETPPLWALHHRGVDLLRLYRLR